MLPLIFHPRVSFKTLNNWLSRCLRTGSVHSRRVAVATGPKRTEAASSSYSPENSLHLELAFTRRSAPPSISVGAGRPAEIIKRCSPSQVRIQATSSSPAGACADATGVVCAAGSAVGLKAAMRSNEMIRLVEFMPVTNDEAGRKFRSSRQSGTSAPSHFGFFVPTPAPMANPNTMETPATMIQSEPSCSSGSPNAIGATNASALRYPATAAIAER